MDSLSKFSVALYSPSFRNTASPSSCLVATLVLSLSRPHVFEREKLLDKLLCSQQFVLCMSMENSARMLEWGKRPETVRNDIRFPCLQKSWGMNWGWR